MRTWGSNSRHNYITVPSTRQIMPAQQVLKSDIFHPGAETAHRSPIIALAVGDSIDPKLVILHVQGLAPRT